MRAVQGSLLGKFPWLNTRSLWDFPISAQNSLIESLRKWVVTGSNMWFMKMSHLTVTACWLLFKAWEESWNSHLKVCAHFDYWIINKKRSVNQKVKILQALSKLQTTQASRAKDFRRTPKTTQKMAGNKTHLQDRVWTDSSLKGAAWRKSQR